MNHADHVNLLRDGVVTPAGVWADFGSGTGAFSLALADLLGPGGEIYAVDKDQGALRTQARAMQSRFPQTTVHYVVADFSRPLPVKLPLLDGLVIANALHFQPYAAQGGVVELLKGYLRPGGRFILVEYDTDRGNPWVLHPLSYQHWEQLAGECGFAHTRRLAIRPSRFLQAIYAAVSW